LTEPFGETDIKDFMLCNFGAKKNEVQKEEGAAEGKMPI